MSFAVYRGQMDDTDDGFPDTRPNVTQLDRRGLRALAHPLRVQLLELLRADGPSTASALGARLGESSGTTSWHLRQLAEHGFVEEDAARGNKRDRWWKSVHDGIRLMTDTFLDDPANAGPLNTYLQAGVQQTYAAEAQFIAELPHWRDTWAGSAWFDNARLSLTPAEARAMSAEVLEVIERYRREPAEGDDTVVTHWAAFPRRAHRTDD